MRVRIIYRQTFGTCGIVQFSVGRHEYQWRETGSDPQVIGFVSRRQLNGIIPAQSIDTRQINCLPQQNIADGDDLKIRIEVEQE